MRHFRSCIFTCLAACAGLVQAQKDSIQFGYAATITEEDLHRHLSILASDEYEGRETGFKGQKMAAEYLREQFRQFGIGSVPAPDDTNMVEGYWQRFELILSRPGAVRLTIRGKELTFLEDYFYFGENVREERRSAEVVVLPSGASLSQMDMRGKWVLITPVGRTSADLLGDIMPRLAALRMAGAAVVFVALPDKDPVLKEWGHQIASPKMRLKYLQEEGQRKKGKENAMQAVFLTMATAKELLAEDAKVFRALTKRKQRKPAEVATDARLHLVPQDTLITGENVLGFIEGTDKRDELIVVTAHYDHIGKEGDEVYNGADDDGSGTVALLEMAEAFMQAKRTGHGPRRSILFMPVAGEEKGLLGSRFYSDHPVFPLANTVANLNIDMIGRTDSVNADAPPYVYIIGSDRLSSELHALNEAANQDHVGLVLDYTFNAPDDPNKFYYRSDHYNFARKGIPVIFYFSGVHEDYHGPKDEVDRIRFDLLMLRTRLVFHTAWVLANREDRIRVDGEVEQER